MLNNVPCGFKQPSTAVFRCTYWNKTLYPMIQCVQLSIYNIRIFKFWIRASQKADISYSIRTESKQWFKKKKKRVLWFHKGHDKLGVSWGWFTDQMEDELKNRDLRAPRIGNVSSTRHYSRSQSFPVPVDQLSAAILLQTDPLPILKQRLITHCNWGTHTVGMHASNALFKHLSMNSERTARL